MQKRRSLIGVIAVDELVGVEQHVHRPLAGRVGGHLPVALGRLLDHHAQLLRLDEQQAAIVVFGDLVGRRPCGHGSRM